jgi:hypothetical protein
MKLSEAIKYKEKPFWIPDCKRENLPYFFKEIGFNKGVEVGVSWAQNIVDYGKAGLEVYGVDPWEDTPDEKFRRIVSIDGKYGKSREGVYKLAHKRTAPYPNIHLIKETSEVASRTFDKRSLDFVYIDANHEFGHVAMDLYLWTKRVRKGGIIAGHDYFSTVGNRRLRQVRYVVNAFVEAHDIDNFWVLGRPDDKDHDRELSFMFFKHW